MLIKSWVALSMLAGAALSAPLVVNAQDVPAEYQQVLSTLGKQGDFKDNVLKVNIPRNDVKVTLDVVAIHHHMTDDRPMIVFLHYWGTGPADKLATGFKLAADELGKHGAATSSR
jgi:hypothetical protein